MLCQCAVLEAYAQYLWSTLNSLKSQAKQLDSHRLKIYTVVAINFPIKNTL